MRVDGDAVKGVSNGREEPTDEWETPTNKQFAFFFNMGAYGVDGYGPHPHKALLRSTWLLVPGVLTVPYCISLCSLLLLDYAWPG